MSETLHATKVYDILIRSFRARKRNFALGAQDSIDTIARSLGCRPALDAIRHRVKIGDFSSAHNAAIRDYCPHEIEIGRAPDDLASILTEQASAPFWWNKGNVARFHNVRDAMFFRLMVDGP